ncbi:MAG: alpha/beta fold hydrolase [Ectothiorhodospiraceae bacterium]|nr:alpha/beta fold hydrolase [Ectothiorhodospiraceae bacterium]
MSPPEPPGTIPTSQSTTEPALVPDREPAAVLALVCDVWRAVLGVADVGPDDDFFELGGDSLLAATVAARLAERTEAPLAPGALVDHSTPRTLAARITSRSHHHPALRALRAGPPPTPALVFVHGVYGFAFFARRLLAHLPPEQEVLALEAPALSGDRALPTSVDAIARDYLAALEQVEPARRWHLVGHCGGALIALAMAARLQRDGTPPAALTLVDPPPAPLVDIERCLRRHPNLARDVLRDPRLGPAARAAVHAHARRRAEIELAHARAPHARVDPAVLDRVAAVGVDLLSLLYAHRPPPYPGPVTFVASRRRARALLDPTLPWQDLVGPGSRLVPVGDDHLDIMHAHRGAIAAVLMDVVP